MAKTHILAITLDDEVDDINVMDLIEESDILDGLDGWWVASSEKIEHQDTEFVDYLIRDFDEAHIILGEE